MSEVKEAFLGMLEGCRFTPEQINQAACDIAKQVKTPYFTSLTSDHTKGGTGEGDPGGRRNHPDESLHLPRGWNMDNDHGSWYTEY